MKSVCELSRELTIQYGSKIWCNMKIIVHWKLIIKYYFSSVQHLLMMNKEKRKINTYRCDSTLL